MKYLEISYIYGTEPKDLLLAIKDGFWAVRTPETHRNLKRYADMNDGIRCFIKPFDECPKEIMDAYLIRQC